MVKLPRKKIGLVSSRTSSPTKKQATPAPTPAPKAAISGQRSRIQEQLEALQARQEELVRQTSAQINELQAELVNHDETAQLESELTASQNAFAELQQQVINQNSQITAEVSHYQENLDQSVAEIENQIANLKQFAQQLRHGITNSLAQPGESPQRIEIPLRPVQVQQPIAQEAVVSPADFYTETFQESITTEEEPRKKTRSRRPVKKFAVRFVALALLLSVGYGGYRFVAPTTTIEQGSVAGAETSSVKSAEPSFDTYAESYAELPFAATEWANTSDTDFALSIDYPKNTTNRVRVIGGNNLWFLRKNGYLMKISLYPTTSDLATWWDTNKANYLTENNKFTQTTFKGQPAYFIESTKKTNTSGSSYFLARPTGVMQIWVKDESPATDDGLRLERMLESLKFTS